MADERGEVVWVNDALGDVFDWYPHVFKMFHACSELEISDAGDEHVCVLGGDGAGEETFDDSDVGGGGADFAWVLDFVASDGPKDSFDLPSRGLSLQTMRI